MRVETGVNDGTTTAIVGGDLPEGARVVTGAAQAAHRRGAAVERVAADAAAAAAAGSGGAQGGAR